MADNRRMDALLQWIPSPVLCFEVNATVGGATYTVTRHAPSGLSQGAHLAYVGDVCLGQFEEGAQGLQAAKRACQSHADRHR